MSIAPPIFCLRQIEVVVMHDWTLVAIHCDWIGKHAEMRFLDSSSGTRVLVFEGVSTLPLDRSEHWGPSNSVNKVTLNSNADGGGIILGLEMQSGGDIIVSAESCTLDGRIIPIGGPAGIS